MSQISIFITVTTTVTGSAIPTLNATQIRNLEQSKQTGQIVALVTLGLFVLLALVLLLGWGILCLRRPRPKPTAVNPDTMRQGKGAFLPIIRGRKKLSGSGLEAARGGGPGGSSVATSQQTLVGSGNGQPQGARRLSMWADEALSSTPSIPYAPAAAAHSRSSSTASLDRQNTHYGHDRTDSNVSSQSTLSGPSHQGYGYVPQYHDNTSHMHVVALESPSLPVVPPKIGLMEHGRPRIESTRYGYNQDVVSPVISPVEDMRLGISRYPQYGGGNRHYDSGMYA